MSPLRVGLSGCGMRGACVVRQVRTHHDCDVVALHDPDPAALAALGDAHAIATRATDFQALLGTGVDFVVLAGPCGDRLGQVQAAAAQGVHCLLHAPMAKDAATAAAMVAAGEAAAIKLGIAVPDQADPLFEQLRQMLADDWLGAVVLITALAADDAALCAPPPPGHWRRDPARAGDSALLQLAAEHLHLVVWLTGHTPLRVTAQATAGFSVLPQDSGVATVLLRGGVLCAFASSHLARGTALSIHGTDGELRLAGDRLGLRGRKEWHGEIFDYLVPDEPQSLLRSDVAAALAAAAPQLELHGRFARWIDDRDDFPCPGEQGAQDMRVLDAIARAAASGHTEVV